MFKISTKFICMVVLLGCFHASYSQYWHHNKVVSKQSEKPVIETAPPYFNNKNIVQKLEKQYLQQQDLQPLNGMKIQQNPWFNAAPESVPTAPQPITNEPIVGVPVSTSVQKPEKHIVPNGHPFPIQQPVLSYTGEIIIENTVGGIAFDCRGLPTGHWRDPQFCDVFHACVHGYHRKTYTCPIVGLRTYFDEITQKCEFVHMNPAGCGINSYVRK